MGTKGREIVEMDVELVIKALNKAFADEWLAYFQYWVGAKVVKGPMKEAVIAELNEHAADELRHAGMVANRIIQLGGTPLTNPVDWPKHANCAYESPDDPCVHAILKQNIKGEQCAITAYKAIMDLVRGKDQITYKMALQILEDEVEHEEDLQSELEDMEILFKTAKA